VDPVVTLRRRPRRVWIAVGLAFLVPAGCTATGDTAHPLPGTTSSTSSEASTSSNPTVSVVDKAKQEALTAYRAMWQDFVTAGRTSDWQSPQLAQHATGIALQNLSRGLYADHQNGVVSKGEPVLEPAVSSVEPVTDPEKVVITDCGDSTNFLKYDKDTDRPVDNEPGGRQLINAVVELQADGSW
jgi:hypothetical protein